MLPPDIQEAATPSRSSRGTPLRELVAHLARSDTAALATLLGPSTMALLSKLGPDATSPAGLAYFIVSVNGEHGALRRQDIRDLLLSKLEKLEATDLCNLLQLPVISPLQTLRGINFDAAPKR